MAKRKYKKKSVRKRIGTTGSRCRTKKEDYERLAIAVGAGVVVGFLLRGDVFN